MNYGMHKRLDCFGQQKSSLRLIYFETLRFIDNRTTDRLAFPFNIQRKSEYQIWPPRVTNIHSSERRILIASKNEFQSEFFEVRRHK